MAVLNFWNLPEETQRFIQVLPLVSHNIYKHNVLIANRIEVPPEGYQVISSKVHGMSFWPMLAKLTSSWTMRHRSRYLQW